MTDDNIELTRRRILGSVGAVGAAGAAAGLGTSALFSDEEEFENNSITAGTLDMVVEAAVVATVDNDYWNSTVDLVGKGQTADGPAVGAAIDIGDAKPGDWLLICFKITNEDNPGYVQVSTDNLVGSENGVTEPEADANGETNTQPGPDPGEGEGELAEKLLATVWDSVTADPPGDTSSRSELEGLQFPTNEADGDKPSHSWTSDREEDGNVPGEDEIDYTDLRRAHNNFSDGVVIKDSSGAPLPVGTDEDVNGPAADFAPAVFYLLLEIPREVGNEIQSDSVGLDLVFESEQVRNNSNPFGTGGGSPTGPTTQQTKLLPNDGDGDDGFGESVALDGNTAVIGAPDDEDPNGSGAGSAYVFTKSGGSWSQQDKLFQGDPDPANPVSGLDNFGTDVSVDGDTIVVGAPFDETTQTNDPGASRGSAYVFTRSGGAWSQQTKLTPNDPADGKIFGFGVAVDGDTAVIGAVGDDDVVNAGGAAYVFTRSGGSWSQQTKLAPSSLDDNDGLGSLVSLDGDTALIGAPRTTGPAGATTPGNESAYVFTRSGGAWSQQAELTGDDPTDSGDGFGLGTSVDGDTAVVGAPGDDNSNGSGAGSAYVFTRSGGAWSRQDKLLAGDSSSDGFGEEVAVDDDTIVVGSNGDDDVDGDTFGTGSAYVFTQSGGAWSQQTKLTADDRDDDDEFGVWVALDGSTAVVGAPGDEDPNGMNAGSAYVFGP